MIYIGDHLAFWIFGFAMTGVLGLLIAVSWLFGAKKSEGGSGIFISVGRQKKENTSNKEVIKERVVFLVNRAFIFLNIFLLL